MSAETKETHAEENHRSRFRRDRNVVGFLDEVITALDGGAEVDRLELTNVKVGAKRAKVEAIFLDPSVAIGLARIGRYNRVGLKIIVERVSILNFAKLGTLIDSPRTHRGDDCGIIAEATGNGRNSEVAVNLIEL